ncbi:O-antigen ligase family protein [Roseiarcus fermentans]|nr:O-antigen ligase family protein [Roseiarcus fermentans]
MSRHKDGFDPAASQDGGTAPDQPTLRALGDDPIEACLFVGLIAGLAWVPLWLGGNRLLPWSVDAIVFPALAFVYEVSNLARARRHAIAVKRIAVAAALFLAVVVWILAQMSTLVMSGLAHPIWAMASDALGRSAAAGLPGTISVNPAATGRALMRLLTDASVLWLAMQLCRRAARAQLLLLFVAGVVAAYSALGLILAVAAHGAIPFLDAPDGSGFVRSTFANPNSFATYAGLGLITVTALALRLYQHAMSDTAGIASNRIGSLIAATGARAGFCLGALLVILVALLGTASRGGILATMLGVFAVLVLTTTRRRRRQGERIEGIAFVAAAIAVTFIGFGDRFVGRIATAGLGDVSRLAVDAIAMRAILDAPLLGFGYGAFADVFPMYRDQSISNFEVWDLAHNTYVEVWLGLGLVFGTALMTALALLVLKCAIGAVIRQRDSMAPVVATAAALTVGVHALVDFSLQIQAVSLTFMALLGAGVAQSESSRHAVAD